MLPAQIGVKKTSLDIRSTSGLKNELLFRLSFEKKLSEFEGPGSHHNSTLDSHPLFCVTGSPLATSDVERKLLLGETSKFDESVVGNRGAYESESVLLKTFSCPSM